MLSGGFKDKNRKSGSIRRKISSASQPEPVSDSRRQAVGLHQFDDFVHL
jgi:hypothetical protein